MPLCAGSLASMSMSGDGWTDSWGGRLVTTIGWILVSLGLLVVASWIATIFSDDSAANVAFLIVAGLPMLSGVWLVRRGRRKPQTASASRMAVSNGEDDPVSPEETDRRLSGWFSFVALFIGVAFVGFGVALLLGALIEKEVALLVPSVVMAIPGVLLIRFGLRPWREKRKQLESGLPEGLSRRERNRAISDIQRQETRDHAIESYASRHHELIERIEESGHRPQIDTVWIKEGWVVILFCQRCGLKRQGMRRSRRLSPDRPCTHVA